MSGNVLYIFVCSEKKEPMIGVRSIEVIAGRGLKGDRYERGIGAFSKSRDVVRHVTVIALEAVDEANIPLHRKFLPGETRRNIVTVGIAPDDLNSLIGRTFTVGGVTMRGVELCDPCERPSAPSGKPGFALAFKNRGGIRAEVISGGIINIGDAIIVG